MGIALLSSIARICALRQGVGSESFVAILGTSLVVGGTRSCSGRRDRKNSMKRENQGLNASESVASVVTPIAGSSKS